jgi:hypothetical protein
VQTSGQPTAAAEAVAAVSAPNTAEEIGLLRTLAAVVSDSTQGIPTIRCVRACRINSRRFWWLRGDEYLDARAFEFPREFIGAREISESYAFADVQKLNANWPAARIQIDVPAVVEINGVRKIAAV